MPPAGCPWPSHPLRTPLHALRHLWPFPTATTVIIGYNFWQRTYNFILPVNLKTPRTLHHEYYIKHLLTNSTISSQCSHVVNCHCSTITHSEASSSLNASWSKRGSKQRKLN